MKSLFAIVTMFGMGVLLVPQAGAHLFTDDQGRQVEAEVAGMRGDNVILATRGVRGQWPVARLAVPDQAYVREWQATKSAVSKVTVQMTERDGIGEKGIFKAEKDERPSLPEGLPLMPQNARKASYKHYDLQITNPAAVDAGHLRVDYVLYVVRPDGTVGTDAGSQSLESLPAGKTASVKTEGVTSLNTKTTKLKLSISSNSVSAGEKTSRSAERFGGGWVRVIGIEGTVIGESKRLTPELAKLDPPWVGKEETKTDIPMLKSLDGLLELLKNLATFPGAPPAAKKESPGLPPGFPPKP